LFKTVFKARYFGAFSVNILLVTGGYMLMPFGSAFAVYNLGISMEHLPFLYLLTGIFSIMSGPVIGKLSDTIGKFRIFLVGSVITIFMLVIYCNLGITPLWIVIALNIILTVGILARMISASALMTAIPDTTDRGAFMSVNSSVQQVSGGIAAIIAGSIVVQSASGKLSHYNTMGYVVSVAVLITIIAMYFINKILEEKAEITNIKHREIEDIYQIAQKNKETA
jgi:predicted MFS family arabinose efflux permease